MEFKIYNSWVSPKFLSWTIQTFIFHCPVIFSVRGIFNFNYSVCFIMHLSHVTVPEYHTGHCASFVHSNANGMSASQWFSFWCWRLSSGLDNNTKNNTSNECRMWALVNIPLKSTGESRNSGLKCTPVGKHPSCFSTSLRCWPLKYVVSASRGPLLTSSVCAHHKTKKEL